MDLVNKLKSAVSNVLPVGNPITNDHEILAHRASGGPGLLWKIYAGIKRTTKQPVSIFIFEKKQIERFSKYDRELILESMKKGVSQLTRLRHPKILSILHPLEESKESLAFATEPVFASLANVLNQHNNLPNPLPPELNGYKLYDTEIKYGLLQIAEGLAFLHNDVKMIHGNICPESIMINSKGAWKLAGFECCIPNTNPADQSPYFAFREWRTNIPPVTQPKLDYLAPEYSLTKSCDISSDMFSVGVLLYAIFNNGKTVFQSRNEWNAYEKNVAELKRMNISVLGSIPEEIRDHVRMLLNTEPTVRPDADQFSKVPFFQDVGAMTLQYLDTLMQRDNLEKSQFFKSLPKVVAKLPKRVCLQRMLPALMSESANANMVPFILPNILLIAESTNEQEYSKYILPSLIPLFKITDPIQITLIFLQNMNLLLSKTPQADIRNHVLPMVYRSLESNTPQIQELCLTIIPTFASLIEYSSMKNALVPRIRKLCLSTTVLALRVNCLVCLGKLLEYMDKWYVLDEIFPILQEIPSREPAILMSILGIYKVTMTHKKLGVTKEIMATKVLPFILPLCIDNNLNLQQFNAFIGMVKEMVNRVESEHRTKLEQLDTMQKEQRTLQQFAQESVPAGGGMVNGSARTDDGSMMDKFLTGLGMGNFSFFSGAGKTNGQPEKVRNPLEDMNSVPEPKKEDTQLPNRPAKVQLTLEEKQRLAQQKDQQERLKSQTPLMPAAKSSNAPSSAKAQPKDLTSSLLNSDFMSQASKPPNSFSTMSSTSNSLSPMSSTGSSFSTMGSPMGMTSPTGSSMGMGGSTMGSSFGTPASSFGMTGGGFSSSSSSGFGGMQSAPKQSKSMDMSSLDNLLPSSKPRMSMNQMQQQQQRPPGMQQMMGMSPRPMMANQGMMGGGFGQFGGAMGSQSYMSQQQPPPNKLSSQELDEFLK